LSFSSDIIIIELIPKQPELLFIYSNHLYIKSLDRIPLLILVLAGNKVHFFY